MAIPTKQTCSICGRGTLLSNPYEKPIRICSGCHKIEEKCECDKK